MSVIVFLAIAYTGWTRGHIAIDLFEKWLDRPALRYLPAVIAFTGAALFAAIAWRATVETTATISQISNSCAETIHSAIRRLARQCSPGHVHSGHPGGPPPQKSADADL
jgi:TRAP-type C4-dicarboxylate transport system permease small subunit